jgi:hypothetical protein
MVYALKFGFTTIASFMFIKIDIKLIYTLEDLKWDKL